MTQSINKEQVIAIAWAKANAMATSVANALSDFYKKNPDFKSKQYVPMFSTYDNNTHTIQVCDPSGFSSAPLLVEDPALQEALKYVRGLMVTLSDAPIKDDKEIQKMFKLGPASFKSATKYLKFFDGVLGVKSLIDIFNHSFPSGEVSTFLAIDSYLSIAKKIKSGETRVVDIAKAFADVLHEGTDSKVLADIGSQVSSITKGIGKGLKYAGIALDVGNLGLDIYRITQASTYEQKVSSGVTLGLDSINFGVSAGALIATEVGAATVGAFMGALAAPLGAIAFGVGAFVQQLMENNQKLEARNNYFTELGRNYVGGGFEWNDDKTALVPLVGVAIDKIDFSNNTFSFGKNVLYETWGGIGGMSSDKNKPFDIHEGLGLSHTNVAKKLFEGDTVVLPYTPNTAGDFGSWVDSTSVCSTLVNMKGQKRDDGRIIQDFDLRWGTATIGTYSRSFSDTTVEITLGQASKTLIMVDHEGLHHEPNGAGGQIKFNYSLSGTGGHYTLGVTDFGNAWLYEKDKDHPSTWILEDAKKGGAGDISFSHNKEGYWVKIGSGWVWVADPINTKIFALKKIEDGVNQLYRLDLVKQQQTLVSTNISLEWVTKHAQTLAGDLASMARTHQVSSLVVSWKDGNGITLTGVYDVGTKKIISKWRFEGQYYNEIWQYNDALSESSFIGVSADWVKAHSSTLVSDLADLAKKRSVSGFSLQFMRDNGTTLSGYYDASAKKITIQWPQDGSQYVNELWQYNDALSASWFVGVSTDWVKAHLSTLASDLADLAKKRSVSGFSLLFIRDNGTTLSGYYDASAKKITTQWPQDGSQYVNELWQYNDALSASWFAGVSADWIKAHSSTVASDLAKEAKDRGQSVFNVQWADGNGSNLSGYYDAITKKITTQWPQDGSQYALELWQYNDDLKTSSFIGVSAEWVKAHSSTLASDLADLAKKRSVSGFSLLFIRDNGTTLSGYYDASEKKITTQWPQDGSQYVNELWQYNDALSASWFAGVSADWIKAHRNTVAGDLADLAKKRGVDGFTMQWLDSYGAAQSGYYDANTKKVIGQYLNADSTKSADDSYNILWQYDDDLNQDSGKFIGVTSSYFKQHPDATVNDLRVLSKRKYSDRDSFTATLGDGVTLLIDKNNDSVAPQMELNVKVTSITDALKEKVRSWATKYGVTEPVQMYIGVSDEWVKAHRNTLAGDLADLAKKQGGDGFTVLPITVQWVDSHGATFSGYYDANIKKVLAKYPNQPADDRYSNTLLQFNDDLELNNATIIGVTSDYFKQHPDTRLHDLLILAKRSHGNGFAATLDQGVTLSFDTNDISVAPQMEVNVDSMSITDVLKEKVRSWATRYGVTDPVKMHVGNNPAQGYGWYDPVENVFTATTYKSSDVYLGVSKGNSVIFESGKSVLGMLPVKGAARMGDTIALYGVQLVNRGVLSSTAIMLQDSIKNVTVVATDTDGITYLALPSAADDAVKIVALEKEWFNAHQDPAELRDLLAKTPHSDQILLHREAGDKLYDTKTNQESDASAEQLAKLTVMASRAMTPDSRQLVQAMSAFAQPGGAVSQTTSLLEGTANLLSAMPTSDALLRRS